MGKALNNSCLIKYAELAAKKLNIKIPKGIQILKAINNPIPQPIISANEEYQLWIDALYIAYSRFDEEDISCYFKYNRCLLSIGSATINLCSFLFVGTGKK